MDSRQDPDKPLKHLKHELERLVLARGDIASASAAWLLLPAFGELRDTDGKFSRAIAWDDAWWAVWTGAVVSYSRPFTQTRKGGMALGRRWWGNISDEDARLAHQWVMGFRHSLWAHTEQAGRYRTVEVSVEGASERRVSFANALNFPRLRRLCEYWLERLDDRIGDLVHELADAGLLTERALALANVPDQPKR